MVMKRNHEADVDAKRAIYTPAQIVIIEARHRHRHLGRPRAGAIDSTHLWHSTAQTRSGATRQDLHCLGASANDSSPSRWPHLDPVEQPVQLHDTMSKVVFGMS